MAFDIYKRKEIFSLVEMVKHQATKHIFRSRLIDLDDLSGLTMI